MISQNELFIIGRIKDMLIVDGRNHYPDDIEATVQELTGGVWWQSPSPMTAPTVGVIVELKQRGSEQQMADRLGEVRREVTSAISQSHSLR